MLSPLDEDALLKMDDLCEIFNVLKLTVRFQVL